MAARPAKTPQPEFGKKLSEARENAGLTQYQLAQMLEVSPKKIDYYERRAQNPTLGFVKKVATALKVAITDLIGD